MDGIETLRVGISANLVHGGDAPDIYAGRPLLYIEHSMATWMMRRGLRAYMIPFAYGEENTETSLDALVRGLDGVVLHGGADVAPISYGETALRDQWTGDRVRDEYEIKLVHACLAHGIPVLGICRGQQLLNVALGGTLYQDIESQVDDALSHYDGDKYDNNHHQIEVRPDSRLAEVLRDELDDHRRATVNSVHHQAVKDLGEDVQIEATSVEDGVIEAIRLVDGTGRYAAGVQWHPEFQDPDDAELLSPWPVLDDFIAAMVARFDRS
ncbi:MAG: gamma-glutamyl-gamma-aminobutyrate hydrolase family protein [Myxococcota bacterium]